jgi:metalloreductase STEAP1
MFLKDWFYPTLLSICFTLFNFGWNFLNYFIFPKKPCTFKQYLNYFSTLYHTNKSLGYTSLQILAFVYFGSTVASVYQLIDSKKYKTFPSYLDFWLKTRKQFGLLAFWLSTIHVLITIYIMNPTYLGEFLIQPHLISNLFKIKGHLAMLVGALSYILMAIIALTSLNSIRKRLNFNQWLFMQSYFGLFSLGFGTLHSGIMFYNIFEKKEQQKFSSLYLMSRSKLIACYFPIIVIFCRIIFGYIPPIANRLESTRQKMIQERQKLEKLASKSD